MKRKVLHVAHSDGSNSGLTTFLKLWINQSKDTNSLAIPKVHHDLESELHQNFSQFILFDSVMELTNFTKKDFDLIVIHYTGAESLDGRAVVWGLDKQLYNKQSPFLKGIDGSCYALLSWVNQLQT